ncbi:serine/arginine repetitive matrix protein 1-like isoform X2 [Neocloeon triangulifer]|uniref:serine/arginine repetitive matrix protein 1-like isoform X2 n=1 Tax=Neocloeon triangulifer TaxID=2078957 RepID=UPI00286F72BF|nr:serine/arginine repetitive matrix protein 1-like isoform X2 [Neocloeon triangulifer]
MDGFQRKRLNIRPYKAPPAHCSGGGGGSAVVANTGFGRLRDTLDLNLDSANSATSCDSGQSESTPKRGVPPPLDAAKTPNNQPVVLDDEFSPIELFPYSQTQSAPIVLWDYNAVQKSNRIIRRSRQSCGKFPSPPEMKPSKRRTPSPTFDDCPPPKKPSQEGLSVLQQHVKDLQELSSSDEENEREQDALKETEEEMLNSSIHQSLHISDKFDRSMASPDPFDSAGDDENFQVAPEPSTKELLCYPSKPEIVPPKPKEVQISPQESSFEIDDSFAECLIACTEKVESEVRLSQQLQNTAAPPPSPPSAPATNEKKAPSIVQNGLQKRRLNVVVSPSKKAVASLAKKQSDGTEFEPKWKEKIKSATSPLNSSLRASQNGDKSIHRSLFVSPVSTINPPAEKVQTPDLDKSIDPFDESFLEEIDAVEAFALSQCAASADKPKAPAPVIEPQPSLKLPFQRQQSTSSIPPQTKTATTFTRHLSTPSFPAKNNVVPPKPKPPPVRLQITNLPRPQVNRPQPVKPPVQNVVPKPSFAPKPMKVVPSAIPTPRNAFTSAKPPAINALKKSPLVRHKSADLSSASSKPVATSLGKLGGSTIARHRSADFGQANKCTELEIEQKRLEARKKLQLRQLMSNK